jgi:TRAP-type C4-dicarboxylate transport system substrate-binding protein
VRAVLFLLAMVLVPAVVRAEPVVLRMAAIAPDGTSWAREVRAFSREVESSTNGQVKIKWYLGAIAGDELQVIDRIRKDQLDGTASSVTCSKLAPSLKVTRVVGLFQRHDEATNVLSRLHPTVEAEFRRSGFALITNTVFGNEILFTRTPVRTLDEAKKSKLWVWNLDEVWTHELPKLGFHIVPTPVEEAGRAFDEGRVDGFIVLPSATLAYQWSTRARYYTDLRVGLLTACLIIANRAFDALPLDQQKAVRAAGVKLGARFEDVNNAMDAQLLGGLFQKQGLEPVPVSPTLRADFFETARVARDNLDEQLVDKALIEKVNAWLADFRAEHH